MKNATYMYIFPVALLLAFLLYSGAFDREETPTENNPAGQTTSIEQNKWETKTDEQSPVTIKVTPIEFGADAKTWRFSVVFDTHSGSLDDNPLQVAVLRDNKGNTQLPTAWEGAGPGGHHREGVLIFDAINPRPSYVELNVKDVGGIPVRSFRWNIK